MNANARTSITTAAATVVALVAFGACGTEVSPPAEDISREQVQERDSADRTVPSGERTTRNRMDFGDDIGTAEPRDPKVGRRGSGTRARTDFDEYHGR